MTNAKDIHTPSMASVNVACFLPGAESWEPYAVKKRSILENRFSIMSICQIQGNSKLCYIVLSHPI